MWSSGRSDASLEAEFPVPIDVRPLRTARRLRLRFDEASGTLKVTCPARMSRQKALRWALDQRPWFEAQIAAALPPVPFVPGAIIAIEGAATRLVWAEGAPRNPLLENGELRCGGPLSGFGRRIESWLRRQALETMSREVADYALAAEAEARSVSIGDAATRWGSCSSQGRIRLSWRLILAPPEARRYVVAHEVAHLVHLNHGPEFRKLEAQLFGAGLAEARATLRREGPRLRRFGRGR